MVGSFALLINSLKEKLQFDKRFIVLSEFLVETIAENVWKERKKPIHLFLKESFSKESQDVYEKKNKWIEVKNKKNLDSKSRQ